MKILIIDNGGIENINGKYFIHKHTLDFAKDLVIGGFDIGFLQFEYRSNKINNISVPKDISLYTIPLGRGKFTKILSYFKMIKLLITTIWEYDFIYIFYPGNTSILASLISILLRKKYGLYIRGEHDIQTKLGPFIIKKASFCLTVSNLLKKEIQKNNKNCDIIFPMIDFSKKDILFDRRYSNNGVFRCLFVGRIDSRKGIFDLVEAIDILNKKIDFLYFDIVGGGDSFEELKNRVQKYKNVKLYGSISEKKQLLKIYREADLFIFPSHDEGFPRVLYEAMMARVPVITTMVGGIGGFMKENSNCLTIIPKNINSIVNAVCRMIESKELREKLVEQSTKDILELFSGKRKKHVKQLKYNLEILKGNYNDWL